MLHIVLAGVGGYGNTYVNALLDQPAEDVKFDMVDPFPGSCTRLEEAKAAGARLYSTLEEYYAENGSADLVVICTPIHLHTPMIKTALAHGSHVLCEKPLCGHEDDIQSLIDARDAAGRFVDIGYQWSHSKAIRSMKEDILSGVFGAPELLKTIVLWPRDEAYYNRGVGWAGKILSADGGVIRDSVANNATAHYLFNLFFILGDTMDGAKMPETIRSWACKVNNIETFDTAVIRSTFADGAEAVYISSHAVDVTRNPEFVYRFAKGTIVLDTSRRIVATLTDGSSFADGSVTKDYGDPWADERNKLWMALDNLRTGRTDVCCSIEGAAVQTKVIAAVHNEHPAFPFLDEDRQKTKETQTSVLHYGEGLAAQLSEYYESL